MTVTIPVRDKGRLFLPRALRDEAGIDPGDELAAWVEAGRLILEPRASVLARLRGTLADDDPRTTGEIIGEERTEELARAEAKDVRVARHLAGTSDAESAERGDRVLRALGVEP